jgi:hypothetical protein
MTIATVLLLALAYIYTRYGKSLSNRSQLGRVLVIVGLTTFIIISIVKSSLALSLGLVGALSIVRFRTAIKEPEELGYFFISIAIGLGLGANQVLPTLIGFILLGIIIISTRKRNADNSMTQNLIISLECDEDAKSGTISSISSIVSSHANRVDVKRINTANGEVHLNYLVNMDSLDAITNLNTALTNENKGINLTFIDHDS